jgi:hypothetical protein
MADLPTREDLVAKLLEFASIPPEQTKGTLNGQIRACKTLCGEWGYQPALQKLSEIASIDASRTKGSRRDQEAAPKLLKKYLNAIKLDKSGVQ